MLTRPKLIGLFRNVRGMTRLLSSAFRALISGGLGRLPMRQPLCDQLCALPVVASVQDAHVLGIGTQIKTGCPLVHVRVRIRTRYPVPGRAIGRLQSDLSSPVQLGRVRVSWPFAIPIVEDAGRIFPLLHSLAPITHGQGAILLPSAAGYLQGPLT